ncbi:phage head-tail joining protein [Frigidibacter sp. MR17.24]|uniref:phage head-tail joining protein n=1 Tax=Frigidibacter sp. MR17.24 TaxID=3127345 RepID=UPI0030130107
MATITELQRRREELQQLRFDGVRSVRDQNGEQIEYRSDAEIARALAAIDSEIATLQRGRLALIRLQTSKGV